MKSAPVAKKIDSTVAPATQAKPWVRPVLIALVIFPPVLLTWLVYLYGVNVPYWDEWQNNVRVHIAYLTHSLTLNDLTFGTTENRPVVQRAIDLVTAIATHGNNRANMFVNIAIVCITALNFWYLLRKTVPKHVLPLMVLVSWVLFSPVQYENWLWGEQKQMFLPITLFTGMLALTYSQRPFWLKVGLCIVMWWLSLGCFAASFFFWPLVLFVQLMQPKVTRQMRLITTLVWILALWIGMKAYFHNFQRPGDTAPELVLLLPEAAFRHFTGFFGAPFRGPYLPWALIFTAGCVSLVANLLPLVKLHSARAELRHLLPWMAIAILPVMAGASTTLNRLQLGWWQSQAPRYTTFSLLLPLSGVVLWVITFRHWRPFTRRMIVFVAAIGICFYVVTVATSIMDMRNTWIKRSSAKSALAWINIDPENPILGELHPDRQLLQRVANMYSRLGILPPMERTH